jgi:hypothetical protein
VVWFPIPLTGSLILITGASRLKIFHPRVTSPAIRTKSNRIQPLPELARGLRYGFFKIFPPDACSSWQLKHYIILAKDDKNRKDGAFVQDLWKQENSQS